VDPVFLLLEQNLSVAGFGGWMGIAVAELFVFAVS